MKIAFVLLFGLQIAGTLKSRSIRSIPRKSTLHHICIVCQITACRNNQSRQQQLKNQELKMLIVLHIRRELFMHIEFDVYLDL